MEYPNAFRIKLFTNSLINLFTFSLFGNLTKKCFWNKIDFFEAPLTNLIIQSLCDTSNQYSRCWSTNHSRRMQQFLYFVGMRLWCEDNYIPHIQYPPFASSHEHVFLRCSLVLMSRIAVDCSWGHLSLQHHHCVLIHTFIMTSPPSVARAKIVILPFFLVVGYYV